MNSILRKLLVGLVAFIYTFGLINPAIAETLMGCEAPTQTCVDATPCKTISGSMVCLAGVNGGAGAFNTQSSCWQYEKNYACIAKADDCLTLRSTGGCKENVDSPKCALDAAGNTMMNSIYGCSSLTHTYTCELTPPVVKTETVCVDKFGMDGLTWSANAPSATDQFLRAVVGREVQSQTGQQIAAGLSLFGGQANKCTKKLSSLKDCCSGSAAAGSGTNATIASSIGMNIGGAVLRYGATYAAQAGSQFIYDGLVSGGANNLAATFGSAFGADDAGNLFSGGTSGGFGAMGFGTTQSSAAGLFAPAGSSIQIGTSPFYFNPYALAAAVAIMVVMSYLQCDKGDVETVALTSRNLCKYIGSYCSLKIPIANFCIETKQSYCCYNGLLAKSIQIGAHNQLGLSWGTPEAPSCGGLTPDQLTSLDFTGIDFAEFTDSIQKTVQNFDTGSAAIMQDTATKSIEAKSTPAGTNP